jgi:hypothetical protein
LNTNNGASKEGVRFSPNINIKITEQNGTEFDTVSDSSKGQKSIQEFLHIMKRAINKLFGGITSFSQLKSKNQYST